jgi:UDP:flavonoid glycosyltransferase YjiC (YdhE family)
MLFSCLAGYGSLHPLLLLSLAAKKAGHEVAFATGGERRSTLENLGLSLYAVGSRFRGFSSIEEMAGIRVEVILPELLDICETWHPDIVVRGHLEFAACLAAEEMGIPHAVVEEWSSGVPDSFKDKVREPLNNWRRIRGLPPDPALEMLHRYLTLIPFPPSLRGPGAPLPPTAHRIKPLIFNESGDEKLPEWIDSLPPLPMVHATLGTILDRPGLLRMIIEGLADEQVNLILVTGRGRDSAELGALPKNVRVAEYIPHTKLLPRCHAIISHAGAGTLIAAVEARLPMVLIPIPGREPRDAARAVAAGLGQMILPSDVTSQAIRHATLEVLKDPSYRQNLESVHKEIESLPSIDQAVTWLESVARERRTFPSDS